jgi:hypothetical protein
MTNRGGRVCAACSLPPDQLEQLDIDLKAGGESRRAIGKRVGISEGALRRHRLNHRSAEIVALTASQTATVVQVGDDMAGQLQELLGETRPFLEAAKLSGNAPQAMAAIREIRGTWELIGRVTGALKERPPVQINLFQSDDWQDFAEELFEVLLEFPEALAAVKAAMRRRKP